MIMHKVIPRECEFKKELECQILANEGYFGNGHEIYSKEMRKHRKVCELCQMDWEIAKERRKQELTGFIED